MFKHLKTVLCKSVLLSMVLSLIGFTIALAAPANLDTTFGGGGLVTTDVNVAQPGRSDKLQSIARQTDGKIVAAGFSYMPSTPTYDFALTRYNSNGSLDTTFSGDGKLIANFGGIDQAFSLAIQANGKIIVAGQTCNDAFTMCDVALARYNIGGTLDHTFGTNGKQTSDFGGGDNGSLGGIAIQSDGKIVVAGYMWNGTDYDFAVYRYLSDGTQDGMVKIGFGTGRQDYASDLVIQSDGKILVAGYSGDADGNNNNFAVARLNANGSLDTTFSEDGRQTTNFGNDEYASSIALQDDGKIVLAGNKWADDTTDYFALARYTASGDLDTTFNNTGKVVTSFMGIGQEANASDIIVQSDGKIVAFGQTTTDSVAGNDFALARYNANGSLDTTFSGDGKVTVDFDNQINLGTALLQSNGEYILAGWANSPSAGTDFALARLLP
jgi:uncharacterized delta-60 repeat protein